MYKYVADILQNLDVIALCN